MQTSAFRLGLIGFPLGHSLSPALHTAALQSCGLQGSFSLFSTLPDDSQGLQSILARVRSGELHGLNVTIPYKQTVIPLLDELTPTAQSVGAVNTIYLRGNRLIGDNTDAQGFLTDLNHFIGNDPSKIVNRKPFDWAQGRSEIVNWKSAIVLGAGGSACAVVYALLNDDWQITIAARRIEQAQKLADRYTTDNFALSQTDASRSKIEGTHQALQTIELRNYETTALRNFFHRPSPLFLLVNTIPFGMTPNLNQSPMPENFSFPKGMIVYDLVYNPRETKLVKDACAQGLRATTGLGMLIEQAKLSFEIWTGRVPSRELMRASVEM